jgi:hypothetical protein
MCPVQNVTYLSGRSAEGREYLVTRYDPERTANLPALNRLAATLEEVAAKVRAAVK